MRRHLWPCGGRNAPWVGLAALALSLACVQGSRAQDQRPDATQLGLECMKVSNVNGELNLVFWFPDEFWKAASASNPNVVQSQVDILVKIVHPYAIVGVASGKTAPFAAVSYRTEAEIRGLLQLKDDQGKSHVPLPEAQLDPSVPGLLGFLKPAMSRMSGPIGDHTYFYAFPGTSNDGTRICDPSKEGVCEVDIGTVQFKWRLPLGSLLPKQKCPACGEWLSGAYKFCPYDGTRLAGGK